MNEDVEVTKSPQQMALEAREAEEKRLAAQAPFDPKVHGVGVHPAMGPQSVTELHAYTLSLEQRVEALEQKFAAQAIAEQDKAPESES